MSMIPATDKPKAFPTAPPRLPPEERRLPSLQPQQIMLIALLLLEVCLFSITGTNFRSVDTGFLICRLSVDLGLIALALTPVILSGGIDLSVGSMVGLSAVVFGKLTRVGVSFSFGSHEWISGPLPISWAVGIALGVGLIGGSLNALLITKLRSPPLIVTLGSYALFRGIAQGLAGFDNYTDFPDRFLFFGNKTVGDAIHVPWSRLQSVLAAVPAQLPFFLIAAIFFYLLVHRSVIGRGLSAIGYSPEGARYAGIPVQRRVGLVYLLSGLCASGAAILYVARVGQAKADAGTGYELQAIAAVVLGGTSIFGGRGSVIGTLLGLFTIATLQVGLRLSDQPPELAGILTGGLLLAAILTDWKPLRATFAGRAAVKTQVSSDLTMRNSQLAALCFVILVAAGLVAGTNIYLFQTMRGDVSTRVAERSGAQPVNVSVVVGGAATTQPTTMPATIVTNGVSAAAALPAAASIPSVLVVPEPKHQNFTIAMMPKSKGNAYFIACRKGADEAAKEFGVTLLWDGPTDPDPARQNEIVETWIARGVDAMVVACENGKGISTALRKARQKGIKIITYDADAEPDARDFFVNQATPVGIGNALMDNGARVLGSKGEFAIITASLTADNMIQWQKAIEQRRQEKYPDCKMVALRPCDDLQPKAFEETRTLLNAYPNIKLIMAICSPAVPGAAEAVKQSGRTDVKVVGLGLPNENKPYVHEGITDTVILWKTADLGYLSVKSAIDLCAGKLKVGDSSIDAGRVGKITIAGDNIVLGEPFGFTKQNIDQYDF